jgi:hypothetical protein
VLAGAITLFVGWLGVSETAYTAKQLPYIAGCGLGGIFLLGTGAMLWLSADLRDEWRKLDRIEAAIRESGVAGMEAALETAPERDTVVAHQGVDVTPGNPGHGASRVAAGRTP